MALKVAIVRTRPETVVADHTRLLELAGLLPPREALDAAPILALVGDGRKLVGDCTPWQIEGVVRALSTAGWHADELQVTAPSPPDRQSPVGRVLDACGLGAGYVGATRNSGVLLLTGLTFQRRLGLHGALGALVGDQILVDDLVQLARQPERLIPLLKRNTIDACAGVVMDATVCGDGPDLVSAEPVATHLLLAGREPAAVDRVAAQLAGLDPTRIPLLEVAAAAGWAGARGQEIDLVGDVTPTLPRLEMRETRRDPRGWTLHDLPRWLRAGVGYWSRRGLRARARGDRYDVLPWGGLRKHYAQHPLREGNSA